MVSPHWGLWRLVGLLPEGMASVVGLCLNLYPGSLLCRWGYGGLLQSQGPGFTMVREPQEGWWVIWDSGWWIRRP